MKDAEVRPALRCGIVVFDHKSRPGEVFFRSCRGKSVYILVLKGDHILAICQRHGRRVERVWPELTPGYLHPK